MTYYRFTDNDNPMSDWGHAMMAANRESVSHYGENEYMFDGVHAVDIESLEDEIIQKWNECLESEDFGDIPYEAVKELLKISAKEAFESFNPKDMADAALGYDNAGAVGWIWNEVLEPNDILAILTKDGAVVFDKDLLRKVEK